MSKNNAFCPRRKFDDLVEEPVFDELLVYDRTRDRAHCLNATAARVWELCDGSRTIAQITALQADPGGEPSSDAVALALRQLSQAHLLEEPLPGGVAEGLSRRKLLRRLGRLGVAASIPLVVTRLAPGQCMGDETCMPGHCEIPSGDTVGDCRDECLSDENCGAPEIWDCVGGECQPASLGGAGPLPRKP